MEATALLLFVVIGLLAIVSLYAFVTARRPASSPDGGLAVSTEGMKICPKCGMGNLWTERKCSACGNALRG
jgi:hypothetical protein